MLKLKIFGGIIDIHLYVVIFACVVVWVGVWVMFQWLCARYGGARKIIYLLLVQITLSMGVIWLLTWDFDRGVRVGEIDGPVGFFAGVFIAFLMFVFVTGVVLNLISGWLFWRRYRI